MYKGQANGDNMLEHVAEEVEIQPNPFVIQVDPQVLHYASVLYVAGAAVQSDVLAAQAAGAATVPVP